MGADKNIDFPLRDLLKDLRLLFSAPKAREHLNAHRPVGEAIAEVIEVLLGEEGGRHQHRHLLMVFHRQKRGAHRHFRLAEANVAAHQAVHRQRLAHIAQYGVDGLRLIGRGFEREAVAEQLILLFIMFKCVARFCRALGVDIQQLGGHVAHLFGGFLPRSRPRIAAQLVQRRILFRAAGVAANQMQRRYRHVQFGVVRVGQHQVFAVNPARLKRGHAGVAPNPMLKMHHRLADMQLRQVTD